MRSKGKATTISKDRSVRQSIYKEPFGSHSGFLTNDLKGKRQYSLEPQLEFKISQFEVGEKNKFQIFKDVSQAKKADKKAKRRDQRKNVQYEGKTCQKTIQIFRRNYKIKRGNKMKKSKKSILRAPKNRRYNLEKSASIYSEHNSKWTC